MKPLNAICNDKVQIHKEFQTKIKSFRIKLNCECGGEMNYTELSMNDDYTSMIVKCDKCKKSSSLTIHFNDYKKDGKEE